MYFADNIGLFVDDIFQNPLILDSFSVILGAIALSELGQNVTGGIYNIVNPDGVQDFKIKKIRKAGELEGVKREVLREIQRQDMLAQIEMRQKLKDIEDQSRLVTGGF